MSKVTSACAMRWPRAAVWLLAALSLTVAATSARAAHTVPPESPSYALRAEPETQQAAGERNHPLRPRMPGPPPSISVTLPPVAEDLMPARPSKSSAPLQIGIARSVPELATVAATTGILNWTPAPAGGKISAIRITSPDARGVRIGLLVKKLPAAAILRFHSANDDSTYEVAGKTILDMIGANLRSGDASDEAQTYWSPVLEGSASNVEIELPPGADPADVKFAIPHLSHLFAPVNSSYVSNATSGACNVDVTCQPAWANESSATARMLFTVGGGSYLCSGTLLNDRDANTQIPYFISANHCISSQTVASTLVTYWLYRASSCNSGSLNAGTQQLPGGAALLYANAGMDTSFMRLNNSPPAGTTLAGWDATLPALGVAISGIHHPSGDLQKISFGTLQNYEICSTDGAYYTCTTAPAATAGYYSIVWNSGITEGGSSGSGIFLGNSHYLIGTLYGGESSCAMPHAADDYARFDLVYHAALYQWLNKTDLSVTLAGTGNGSVTSSSPGIACGADCSETYYHGESITLTAVTASGNAFAGWNGACSGMQNTCTVTMSMAQSVTATFNKLTGASKIVPMLLLLLLD